jgi:tetratricopeptide (TPR) repeat protein
VGACLADGLHYAHERGLVHLDVKPSNVLLAADGQPMLLDFHLAQPPLTPGAPAEAAWLGGTPAYMPPEQQAALAALRAGAPVPAAVDARADLYALGALLYEALGGELPFRPDSPPLHRCAAGVSVGLSDVVRKCLAPDPRDRYPDAAALAGDLRRVLNDRPLEGVRNRSLRERWRRWRRRRPHALALSVMGLLLGVALLAGGRQWQERAGQARRLLETGQARLRGGDASGAAGALENGLTLADGLPGSGGLADDLRATLNEARRQRAAAELHRLADRVRFLYPFDTLPGPALAELESSCRAAWDSRGPIRERLAADRAGALRLQADLLDLALLGVEMGLKRTGAAPAAEARRVLAEADAEFGPSPVLAHVRRVHARALGLESPAGEDPPARTAWEHYALGRACLSEDDLSRAARHLEEAVRLEPGGLAPHFYAGLCAYRRGRHDEAVAAFSVCIGAAPRMAAGYYNRALAHAARGNTDRAIDDCTQALALDPGLGGAYLNRGILHAGAGRAGEAEADLRRALEAGADPAAVHYNLALVQRARGDRAAALESVRAALRARPDYPPALTLLRALEAEHPARPPRG